MQRRLFLTLPGAALIARYARAGSGAKWSQDFGDYVLSQLVATHTPGVGVAMVKAGQTRFAAGYGYADVETRRRVTPNTIFEVGSVSKTVTATALMLLWQDGTFKLDDSIAPYLDFPIANPLFPNVPVTFRELFTHTSSISDTEYDDLDFAEGNVPPLREFLMEYLVPGGEWYEAKKCYSQAKPGTAWSYSNVAVALLAYLGERLSGTSLEAFTRDHIFRPLGMRDTSWRYEGVSNDRLAQPYDFVHGHFKRLTHNRYPDWPSGLLCTSAEDFAKFLGSYIKATLLKPETIDTMFTPSPIAIALRSLSFPDRRQGLIWELAPMGGSTIVLHPGGDPGAVSLAAIDMKRGTAALCFSNITPTHGKLPFEKGVIDRLLGKANA
jgi:CubicO group peptidase (beta-lactamase class C family)